MVSISTAARRGLRDDPARRLDAVQLGHLDVHQHHVGLAPAREIDRRRPVPGLADDLDAGLRLEDRAEAGAHERLIVGDEHADGHEAHRIGNRARSHHPGGVAHDHHRG